MHKGGKDSCQGDSGGPLIVSDSNNKAVIYGIGLFHVNFPNSQINPKRTRNFWVSHGPEGGGGFGPLAPVYQP